jgi:hypothetical protein
MVRRLAAGKRVSVVWTFVAFTSGELKVNVSRSATFAAVSGGRDAKPFYDHTLSSIG